MEKSLIKTINNITKEYNLNHKRWQYAKKIEDTSLAYKFEKVEHHLRFANEILKELELLNNGTEYFMPRDTYFEKK